MRERRREKWWDSIVSLYTHQKLNVSKMKRKWEWNGVQRSRLKCPLPAICLLFCLLDNVCFRVSSFYLSALFVSTLTFLENSSFFKEHFRENYLILWCLVMSLRMFSSVWNAIFFLLCYLKHVYYVNQLM